MAQAAEKPVSVVQNKGRRGNPLPGCDCVVCFGYCLIDGDERIRVMLTARGAAVIAEEESSHD